MAVNWLDDDTRPTLSINQRLASWFVIGFMTVLFVIALVGAFDEWGRW